jgi:hypothetical protein
VAETAIPRELTRGYGNAFLDMLKQAAERVLTIKDLQDLDDADADGSVPEDDTSVESDHDAALCP